MFVSCSCSSRSIGCLKSFVWREKDQERDRPADSTSSSSISNGSASSKVGISSSGLSVVENMNSHLDASPRSYTRSYQVSKYSPFVTTFLKTQ